MTATLMLERALERLLAKHRPDELEEPPPGSADDLLGRRRPTPAGLLWALNWIEEEVPRRRRRAIIDARSVGATWERIGAWMQRPGRPPLSADEAFQVLYPLDLMWMGCLKYECADCGALVDDPGPYGDPEDGHLGGCPRFMTFEGPDASGCCG